MSRRREFPARVKRAAWLRSGGHCERCTAKLFPGKIEYDHVLPDGLGGEPTLENCECVCSACHTAKTHGQDRPRIHKAERQAKRHLGIRKPSRLRGRRFEKAEPQRRATRPLEKWRGWTNETA